MSALAASGLELSRLLADLTRRKFIYRCTPHGVIETKRGRDILMALADQMIPGTDEFLSACNVLLLDVGQRKIIESTLGYWERVE